MIFHLFTCIFLFQSPLDSEERMSMREEFLKDETTMTVYLGILYFNITTFSTVGFGDIYPIQSYEMFTTIVSILVGQLLFSYLSG